MPTQFPKVREILEAAVTPEGRAKLGSMLAGLGRFARLADEGCAIFVRCVTRLPLLR